MNNKCDEGYEEKLIALLGLIAEQRSDLDKLKPRCRDLEYANRTLKEQATERDKRISFLQCCIKSGEIPEDLK